MSLDGLTALARRELEQLRYPAPNWVLPRDGFLDVVVVGGGMCGQTATFALLREGVTNLRCLDRAARGHEGPWTTFARMDILRSPKHLTGPDLGIASLTYRAYHEAKFGVAHWEKLHKIDRVEWARYLMWVRETAGIPGAGASAFDNAAEALEAGAAGVVMFARRPILPQVNKSKWTAFPGFLHG